MRAIAVLVILILALCACGSAVPDGSNESFRSSPARAPSATPATQPTFEQPANPNLATANGETPAHVQFTPLTVSDPAAEGTGAFALLVPDGWQAQGSVQWMPDWERLAYLQTTVTDPSTGITIDWLPIQNFIWFDAPSGFTAPIGGNYQGKRTSRRSRIRLSSCATSGDPTAWRTCRGPTPPGWIRSRPSPLTS